MQRARSKGHSNSLTLTQRDVDDLHVSKTEPFLEVIFLVRGVVVGAVVVLVVGVGLGLLDTILKPKPADVVQVHLPTPTWGHRDGRIPVPTLAAVVVVVAAVVVVWDFLSINSIYEYRR